ncbi:helix-turn-helix domain-containing protein [Paenibacillus sp. URB8-2]|uniref:helix-turn-helix domain-containing protein n=1 Tax=Paenibacillus sp. URB8-2 TaxID=2741301 RepID=UPI0015BA5CF1|nr:hypothetical protein PUR_02160 [Paenibacillus sp. URB8-2]
MISAEAVGKRICTLRKEKQLSQEQLAEQLNVSAQAVSKWETGYYHIYWPNRSTAF